MTIVTNINDLPYSVALCVRLLAHAALSRHTENLTGGDIKKAAATFFTPTEIEQAVDFLTRNPFNI
jgi:hypothetical protein